MTDNPIVRAIYNKHTWAEIEQMYAPRGSYEAALRLDFAVVRMKTLMSLHKLTDEEIAFAMSAINREMTYRALVAIHAYYCGQHTQRMYDRAIQSPSMN